MSDRSASEILALKSAVRNANVQMFGQDFDSTLISRMSTFDPQKPFRDLLVETVEETLKKDIYQGLDIPALQLSNDHNTQNYSEVCKRAIVFYYVEQFSRSTRKKDN